MLISIVVIVLKVFWIDLSLLWRDMARPYKTRNGKWSISRVSSKMPMDYYLIKLLITMLSTRSPFLFSVVFSEASESSQRLFSKQLCGSRSSERHLYSSTFLPHSLVLVPTPRWIFLKPSDVSIFREMCAGKA